MADFIKLGSILSGMDWSAPLENNDFDDLPEGYYLCEVENAVLKENKAQTNQQVSFTFKIVQDGLAEELDDNGDSVWKDVSGTHNRKIFKHYPFKDEKGVRRFVSDMLKFEGETPGEPLLTAEYFMTEETFPDALDILKGMQIYVQAAIKEYQGKKNVWYELISWDRAAKLGLPVE